MNTSKTFGTVLVGRDELVDAKPTELEVVLQAWSNRVRVVKHLTAGAHVLFPCTGGVGQIAIRFYDVDHILKMESEMKSSNYDENNENIDNLQQFRANYKNPLVFFQLPVGELQRDQLGRVDSFFFKAQETLMMPTAANSNNAIVVAKVFVVPDIVSCLGTVLTFMDSMKQEKIELQRQFFQNQATKLGLPDDGNSSSFMVPSEPAYAINIAQAFREWAERFEVPPGEADVLLSLLGSLGSITTADYKRLESIPIQDSTKALIAAFFGRNEDYERYTAQQAPNSDDAVLNTTNISYQHHSDETTNSYHEDQTLYNHCTTGGRGIPMHYGDDDSASIATYDTANTSKRFNSHKQYMNSNVPYNDGQSYGYGQQYGYFSSGEGGSAGNYPEERVAASGSKDDNIHSYYSNTIYTRHQQPRNSLANSAGKPYSHSYNPRNQVSVTVGYSNGASEDQFTPTVSTNRGLSNPYPVTHRQLSRNQRRY